MASISKTYSFSAAHHLPQMPDGHPCKRVHGHNYEVIISIVGKVNIKTGMILDYAELDKVVDPLIDDFDHRDLNEMVPFTTIPPTAENLAMTLHTIIRTQLHKARHHVKVTVKETSKTAAVYP